MAGEDRPGTVCRGNAVNDIDVSVLGHLTDTDSEKMRASLGYRRETLAALLLRELGKSA
jgi:hypothetical protein